MKRYILRSLVVVSLALAAACSDPPYIYDAAAIDRNHPDFGKTLTDRTDVQICYNTRGATPTDVTELARKACGEFGKIAVFRGQNYKTCPLSHPVAASFSCEIEAAKSGVLLPRF